MSLIWNIQIPSGLLDVMKKDIANTKTRHDEADKRIENFSDRLSLTGALPEAEDTGKLPL